MKGHKHNTNPPYSPAYPGLPKITVEDLEPLSKEKRKSNLKKKSVIDAAKSYELMEENERLERFLSPVSAGLLKRAENATVETKRSSLEAVMSDFFGNEQEQPDAEDTPMLKERFPGCWILGHGTFVTMPIEFKNPYLVSMFIGRLVKMNLCFCASRASFIFMTVLVPSLRGVLYSKYEWAPFGVSFAIFFVMSCLVNMRITEKYVRQTPINVVVLIVTEISFTCFLMFLSLFAEWLIQKWYLYLDLFEDLVHDGFQPYEVEFWPNLHLTPAVFVAIAHLQIMVNLITIYIMNLYTKVRYTSKMVYYVMTFQTFFTSAFAVVILKDNSYRVSYVWDNLQLFVAPIWAMVASFLYVQHITRLVNGKVVCLNGMAWQDLVLAAVKVSYL